MNRQDPKFDDAIRRLWNNYDPGKITGDPSQKPPPTQKPTPALDEAARILHRTAILAGPASQDALWQFQNTLDNKDRTSEWIAKLEEIVKHKVGRGGTDQNTQAADRIWDWLPMAIARRYDMANDGVMEAFAYFLLSVQTDGFVGSDVTGTTMGGYRGEGSAMGAFYEGGRR